MLKSQEDKQTKRLFKIKIWAVKWTREKNSDYEMEKKLICKKY